MKAMRKQPVNLLLKTNNKRKKTLKTFLFIAQGPDTSKSYKVQNVKRRWWVGREGTMRR